MKKIFSVFFLSVVFFAQAAFPAQHDGDIGNDYAPAFRADLNRAVRSFQTNNSGAVDPGTTQINAVVFTGTGLNDATSGGTYTAADESNIEIIIDAAGTPDTFKWRKNIGVPSGNFTAGVSITGAAQILSDGVTVTFGATTGHTLNDQWEIFAHKGKTYPYMYWADTANDLLKQRNAADTAWVSMWTLSTGVPSAGGSAPGTDSVGTTELNDGADSPLTGQCVVVDAADNTKFEYIPCPSGGGGDNVSVDGAATVDPNFADTGDINFTNSANVISGDVQVNSVALGTDTTGGYAASTTEGGPATTATALAANGGNCLTGNYPLGINTLGAVETCTPDDDVPDAGDFGNATDLDLNGAVVSNAVALGTDTTGGYAASTTEGGPATTATAFASVPTKCAAGSYTIGINTTGDAQTCTDATTEINSAITARTETKCVKFGDETTAITTGTAKFTFHLPFAFTLTAVYAYVTTVSSSGIPTFDINESGTTVLSTKLTIDASEDGSDTAATAAVISDSNIAAHAPLSVDIDVAGTGTKGPSICFDYNQ